MNEQTAKKIQQMREDVQLAISADSTSFSLIQTKYSVRDISMLLSVIDTYRDKIAVMERRLKVSGDEA